MIRGEHAVPVPEKGVKKGSAGIFLEGTKEKIIAAKKTEQRERRNDSSGAFTYSGPNKGEKTEHG